MDCAKEEAWEPWQFKFSRAAPHWRENQFRLSKWSSRSSHNHLPAVEKFSSFLQEANESTWAGSAVLQEVKVDQR